MHLHLSQLFEARNRAAHQGKMKGNSADKTYFLVNHKNMILLLMGGLGLAAR